MTRTFWWSCGAKEKVSFSHCVPTILQMVLNAKAAQRTRLRWLEIVIGGSALNRALYEAAKAKGIQLTAAYGMSETGPLISCAHLNDELMAGTEDERTTYRIKAGVPGPLVEAAHRRRPRATSARRWRDPGRAGAACAVADQGVFQRAAEGRRALGWGLAAHR